MGSTKVAVVATEKDEEFELKKREKEFKRQQKLRDKVDIQEKIEAKVEENISEGKVPRATKTRSRTYVKARRQVDRTKIYDLKKAIELVKSTSYSSFIGTISADLIVKDAKVIVELAFPHSTGRSVTVAIADDEVIKNIEAGNITFDVLLSTPAMMPKLTRHAKVLGPKGLMPNPKNQTVSDNPEKRKKELEAGKITLKTEKKAPLMHVVVGKTDLDDKKLASNIEALIKAVGPKKIRKLTLSATMSPGIKVDLNPYQTA
jgi:large subunit ribosomal protein L1